MGAARGQIRQLRTQIQWHGRTAMQLGAAAPTAVMELGEHGHDSRGVRHRERTTSKHPGGCRGERDGRNCTSDRGRIFPPVDGLPACPCLCPQRVRPLLAVLYCASMPVLDARGSLPGWEPLDTALSFRPPVIRQQLLQVQLSSSLSSTGCKSSVPHYFDASGCKPHDIL